MGLQGHEGLGEMFDAHMFRQCASTAKSLRDLCAQLVCMGSSLPVKAGCATYCTANLAGGPLRRNEQRMCALGRDLRRD